MRGGRLAFVRLDLAAVAVGIAQESMGTSAALWRAAEEDLLRVLQKGHVMVGTKVPVQIGVLVGAVKPSFRRGAEIGNTGLPPIDMIQLDEGVKVCIKVKWSAM
ncbi:hypothetical protein HYQ46_010121 [Verticillium longisporum]|nr:hypothetical protein HYQ46_010121 [Verticillium longisporum]